jgi:hypothetical protein
MAEAYMKSTAFWYVTPCTCAVLLIDVISSSDCITLNCWTSAKWPIGKDSEGSGHGLIEVLSEHLTGGARKNEALL